MHVKAAINSLMKGLINSTSFTLRWGKNTKTVVEMWEIFTYLYI